MEEVQQVPQETAQAANAQQTDFEPEILAFCCEH
jgi:hypothetical protein